MKISIISKKQFVCVIPLTLKAVTTRWAKTRNRNHCGKHRIPEITFQHSQTMTKVLLMVNDRNYF